MKRKITTGMIQQICGVDHDSAQAFMDYHKANPDIWKAFEAVSLRLTVNNRSFGAKAVMEIIRRAKKAGAPTEPAIVKKASESYKISNSYTAYYARVFMYKHPKHGKFFKTKELRGLRNAKQEAEQVRLGFD